MVETNDTIAKTPDYAQARAALEELRQYATHDDNHKLSYHVLILERDLLRCEKPGNDEKLWAHEWSNAFQTVIADLAAHNAKRTTERPSMHYVDFARHYQNMRDHLKLLDSMADVIRAAFAVYAADNAVEAALPFEKKDEE